MTMLRLIIVLSFITVFPQTPSDNVESELEAIDEDFSGNIGVYIKNLDDGEQFEYATERDWYLASTVKIPIGIAILQRVEAGELSLDDTIALKESDFVDGSGDLMFQEPGTEYTVLELLERMIRDSDSTATDMLIRFLGEDSFNDQVSESIISQGVGRITTIMQVRYDAYSEITPDVKNLSNLDIVELKEVTPLTDRYAALLQKLEAGEESVNSESIVDAFERYYRRGINSGSLSAMGEMLEKLHNGDYLNEEHTKILMDIMKSVNTGDRRIKAGLGEDAVFAHKTGTQIGRSCNMGIVNPGMDKPVVVAVCAEKYGELREAEIAFQKVGELVSDFN